jgi:hypothetical protein
MDLELLNYWIKRIGFQVIGQGLYLGLKAYKDDWTPTYKIMLSNDSKCILDFFGFDTSVLYDELTESSVFVFLGDSKVLKPEYIEVDGFKGYAKNAKHKKYNQYLMNNFRCWNFEEFV